MPWKRPHAEQHLSFRSNWLRAAVLGANDGILSTASLVLGVAASGASRGEIVTAGIAGMVAGAGSMAAGEYVSVSSQRDTEDADLRLEARELAADPEGELAELTGIYEGRGLPPELALEVATALSRGRRARRPRPRRARPPRGAPRPSPPGRRRLGPLLRRRRDRPPPRHRPLRRSLRILACVVVTLIALGGLGTLGARLGGAPVFRAAVRVVFWGAVAMAATSAIGVLVGAAV